MEDDTEVLDWGHEEELAVADKPSFDIDDAEDAVSLGGDEEDEFLTYQSRVPAKTTRQQRQDPPIARSESQEPAERTGSADLPPRTLVHALPPKPVLSTVPFVHPSHPSIIEATAMASRADREKRNGAGVYDDSLPPGWEVKYPRNGRGVYYYNIHTQESTWTRPSDPSSRERSDRRDDPLDKPLTTRSGETLIPRVGRTESGDMSYDDRHYRPGESARREERPARSSQRLDSYVPESYSHSRTSSPRARERDLTPPPRRPSSPIDSYGDREGVQTSYREAPSAVVPSAQDRVRDSGPHERTRERRQRGDPPPSEPERRNHPRDTERSSTLSTLSASSPPPTSRTRRARSSQGGGRSISQTSREALGVELRLTILFLFVRLPRMDTRTLIMDPLFSLFATYLLSIPFCIPPRIFFL
ncbi:hypothetical protein OG21DRAFT_421868 [Imleria badia]|nr:hypothetical protein OG21DRAFT_421868 [Imleria badia]